MRTLRLNDTEYAFCDELGMETVDVRELKLQGCMGCGACERRIHHGGECAVADDMQMLYPKIAQCEKLVFICRQSFGCCSPKCKRILDRMAVLGYPEYTVKNRELTKKGWKIPLREIEFLLYGEATPQELALFEEWLEEIHGITGGTLMRVQNIGEEAALCPY